MITAGVDMGAKTVKVVVLKDGEVAGRAIALSGFEHIAAAEKALGEALASASVARERLDGIVSTGAGGQTAPLGGRSLSEVGAAARGARHLYPDARTVIDVGAEEGRGIRIDETGRVADFAVNEKCAAGAGAFTEAMSRALEIPLEQMGPLSLRSTRAIPMNAQCAVFAESEVVSLVHSQATKEDIARAVHDAIASRIVSMVRRVGVTNRVVLIGGLARNVGFVESLRRTIETEVAVADDPEYVAALGAALHAAGR